MASLIDIGRSGVLAQRDALAVTGQNIVNVNTEGYSRRDVVTVEVSGSAGAMTSLAAQTGLGVRVGEIRRAFDEFVTERSRSADAKFEAASAFDAQIRTLQNQLLPSEGDLGSIVQAFFTSLSEVAAQPGDVAPRMVAIEQGKMLASAVRTSAETLGSLSDQILAEAKSEISELNALTTALASTNAQISAGGQSGKPPIALLDERDLLIDRISSITEVSVQLDTRGQATLTLGATFGGVELVNASRANALTISAGDNGLVITTGLMGKGAPVQLTGGGALRGLTDAYGAVSAALDDLNTLASAITVEMNTQHMQGTDLEGQKGKAMFSSTAYAFEAENGNLGNASMSLSRSLTDPDGVPELRLSYKASTDLWSAVDASGQVLATGRKQLSFDGGSIAISGTAADGDGFVLSKTGDAALNMTFLLSRSQEIAASSGMTVQADIGNDGSATVTALLQPTAALTDKASIDSAFNNGLSSVAATSFLREGVVAVIPANATAVELASFGRQSSLSFVVSDDDLALAGTLGFTVNGTAYEVDVTYSSLIEDTSDDAVTWTDLTMLADYLNSGVLKTDDGYSMADLGIYASGGGGRLVLAATTDFSDTGQITGPASDIEPTLTAAVDDASDIQIFTREGRHIAGTALTSDQIASLITTANGFSAEAEYRADYLNLTGADAYRGMGLEVMNSAGTQTLVATLDGDGVLQTGTDDMPGSNTDAQTITITATDYDDVSVDIPAGVSAGYAARTLAEATQSMGIAVTAITRLELTATDTDSSESLTFELTGSNLTALTIDTSISSGDMTNLRTAINRLSSETGIVAETSSDGMRLILTQSDGEDIRIGTASGAGLSVQVLDADYSAVSDATSISGTTGLTDLRAAGRLSFSAVMSDTFSTSLGDSTADTLSGGLVSVEYGTAGESLTLDFAIEEAIDGGDSHPEGLAAQAPAASYSVTMPASYTGGTSFTATISSADLTPADKTELAAALAASLRADTPVPSLVGEEMSDLPDDGTSLTITLAGDSYTLTMVDSEVVVSGPEDGRLTAVIGSDMILRLSAAQGILSGEGFAIPEDADVSGNEAAAALFGLSGVSTAQQLTGASVSLPTDDTTFYVTVDDTTETITMSYDSDSATWSVTTAGATDLTVAFATGASTSTSSTDALVLYGPDSTLPMMIEPSSSAAAAGFNVAAASLRVVDGQIQMTSRDGAAISVDASGSSLASSRVRLTDLPDEELIVITSGGGANRLSAAYDLTPASLMPAPDVEMRVMNAAAGTVEIFDRDTGHSIATRTLRSGSPVQAAGFSLSVSGALSDDDIFRVVSGGAGATGDASNLDAMLTLETGTDGRGGFQGMFQEMLTRVGASVQASGMTLSTSTALKNAADNARSESNGVNLDTEAAHLLEQQQAYQAAARILSTAKELFDTLLQLR